MMSNINRYIHVQSASVCLLTAACMHPGAMRASIGTSSRQLAFGQKSRHSVGVHLLAAAQNSGTNEVGNVFRELIHTGTAGVGQVGKG